VADAYWFCAVDVFDLEEGALNACKSLIPKAFSEQVQDLENMVSSLSMRSLKFLVFVVSISSGFSSLPVMANIFGKIDRVPVDFKRNEKGELRAPVENVGWLTRGDSDIFCSAIVVGRSLVLTARHCLEEGEDRREIQSPVHFHLLLSDTNGIKEFVAESIPILWGEKQPPLFYFVNNYGGDWVFLKLKKSLSVNQGYFLLSEDLRRERVSTEVSVAGYSSYFGPGKLTYQSKCGLRGSFDEENNPESAGWIAAFYFHDCDVGRGDSGGALFREDGLNNYFPILEGLLISERGIITAESKEDMTFEEYSDERANVAIKASMIALDVYYERRKIAKKDVEIFSEILRVGHRICMAIKGRSCPDGD